MDKGAYHPLTTAVGNGDLIPGSPSTVSFLSRLVLGLAPGLRCVPPSGGPARMVIRALPTEVPTTNVYCGTCLRTRRPLPPGLRDLLQAARSSRAGAVPEDGAVGARSVRALVAGLAPGVPPA
jgi:hypothetical protein